MWEEKEQERERGGEGYRIKEEKKEGKQIHEGELIHEMKVREDW